MTWPALCSGYLLWISAPDIRSAREVTASFGVAAVEPQNPIIGIKKPNIGIKASATSFWMDY